MITVGRLVSAVTVLATLALTPALSGSAAEPPKNASVVKPASGDMNAHFIDVGQGAAVLLEFDCGAVLVDTGGEKHAGFNSTVKLTSYLDDFFDRRSDLNKSLEMVILTHAHIDHTRNIETVMDNYTVKALVDNSRDFGSGGSQQGRAHKAAKQSGGKIKYLGVKQRETDSNLGPPASVMSCSSQKPKFRFLWGDLHKSDGWTKKQFDEGNNHSVVTRLEIGSTSFLFPGDLEEDIQEDFLDARCPTGGKACLVDVDFYHVSHHGSANGTSPELLEKMSPKVAVLSMGTFDRRGSFSAQQHGHPRASVINRLIAPPGGVTDSRTSVSVKVAHRGSQGRGTGPQFTDLTLTKALFGTGWKTDESFVLAVKKNGTFTPVLKTQ